MPCDDDDAVLADEDTLWAADEEAVAETDPAGEPRPPVVDPAAEEVSPAGDCPGVGVCPLKAVTAKPVTAAATRKPVSHASASGRHKRRRGRFLPPGGGWSYVPPGGCVPWAAAACSPRCRPATHLPGPGAGFPPLGTCAAELAAVVAVAASANAIAGLDPNPHTGRGWRGT